jgi:non-ribosomal peptide synthetase component F
MATTKDLGEIWRWNSQVPETVETCVHEIISSVAQQQKHGTLAVDAWDGQFTYQQLELLSTCLAQ